MARPPGNIVPKVGGKDRLRNVSSFAVDLAPSAWVGPGSRTLEALRALHMIQVIVRPPATCRR
jgi:hypothetical protein